jgi:hypothetical protein
LEGKEHDLAALQAGQDKTDAELNALRMGFAELALGIANKATQPVTEAVTVVAETQVPEPVIDPPEPVIEPVINEADLPCQEFEGVFRVWHCEDGKRMYP